MRERKRRGEMKRKREGGRKLKKEDGGRERRGKGDIDIERERERGRGSEIGGVDRERDKGRENRGRNGEKREGGRERKKEGGGERKERDIERKGERERKKDSLFNNILNMPLIVAVQPQKSDFLRHKTKNYLKRFTPSPLILVLILTLITQIRSRLTPDQESQRTLGRKSPGCFPASFFLRGLGPYCFHTKLYVKEGGIER